MLSLGTRLFGTARLPNNRRARGNSSANSPVWSAAPNYSITAGIAYSNQSVPVSAGGDPITLSWVSPGSKPAWVSFTSDSSPTISFSGAQVDADDVANMVLSATANGNTVNSSAGSITVSPADASTDITGFSITSVAGGADVPFAIGHPFKQGDIPSNYFISTSTGGVTALRGDVQNRWPDGSVKFAVISGRASLTASVEKSITISRVAIDPAGAPVSIANLKSFMSGQTCRIDYGSYGFVSWTGSDWDSPFLWKLGSTESDAAFARNFVMSSWIYRKPIGSDLHLVGWIEVRVFANGSVEVVPWIENGYLKVANPDQKSGTATFTLGSTSRFSQFLTLKPRQRFVLCGTSVLSHWLGSDPGISWKHDVSYFQTTKLTPAYRGVTASGATIWSTQLQTYTPGVQGQYHDPMADTGYQPHIGPMPEWDTLYLSSSADPRSWRALQINAYIGGKYPIHYRDELTNRPVRLSQRPNLAIASGSINGLGSAGGGSSTNDITTDPASNFFVSHETWDTAHHPVIGYMAYLITGRYYFMEELQFNAMINVLKEADNQRGFGLGYCNPERSLFTQRGSAWSVRTIVSAANCTPDADALKSDFTSLVNAQINFYSTSYPTDSYNLLGSIWGGGVDRDYLAPGTTIPDRPWLEPTYGEAPWQDDWVTYAFGLMNETQVTTGASSTTLNTWLAWKFKGIVGRFGGQSSTEFCYRDAAQYDCPVMPNDDIDAHAGAQYWYQNWGEVWTALNNGASNNCNASTLLQGGSAGNPAEMATGYWGNLMPAISYAVDFGAAGALTGYQRMTAASNWASSAATFDTVTPVWSVTPRSNTLTSTPLLTQAQQQASKSWKQFHVNTNGLNINWLRIPGGGNILGFFDKGKHDTVRRQLWAIGKDANAQGNHERLMIYDEASDQWTATDTATLGFPAHTGHGYCHNAFDPATGDFFYRLYDANNPIMKHSGSTWSTLAGPQPPLQFPAGAAAIEWFPNANVLVFAGRKQLWTLSGSTWTNRWPAADLTIGTNHAVAIYSKARGCLYFGGGNTDVNGGLYRLSPGALDAPVRLADPPVNWAVAQTISVIEPVTGDLMITTGTTWYRFYDDGSNNGLGQWQTYSIGTGGDGKPTIFIAGQGCVAYTLDAPYNCMVFLRDANPNADMWIYKD